MGTPRGKRNNRELKSMEVLDILQLIRLGDETGRGLKIENLPVALEEMVGMLSPLVPWLDSEIFLVRDYGGLSISDKFFKKRGVLLFESSFSFPFMV